MAAPVRQEHFDNALTPPKADATPRGQRQPAPRHIQTVEVLNQPARAVENLIRRFPAVLRMAGREMFNILARSYMQREGAAAAPVADDFGGDFPAFLEDCHTASNLPYLPDLARFEWMRWKAWLAPARASLSGKHLCAVPPRLAPRLIFEIQPSLGIIASPYSIVSIWETYTADDETRRKSRGRGWEEAMVVRVDAAVRIRRMPPGAYQFIDKIRKGATLIAALEAANDWSAQFDMPFALKWFAWSRAITSFRVADGA
jgi:hypothetical protein